MKRAAKTIERNCLRFADNSVSRWRIGFVRQQKPQWNYNTQAHARHDQRAHQSASHRSNISYWVVVVAYCRKA